MKQLYNTIILCSLLFLGIISPINAQISEDSEVFKTLKTKDSLLFNVGFNECDLDQFKNLTTEDLEFYHDENGVLNTNEEFINVMANGICKKDNPYKARRELVEGSLQVFPMYDNGKLYGAVQNGEHKFYERFEGTEKAGSTAKFSQLWVLEDNQWKIKCIYSFNHHL
ncbi:MAG: nuclear transport factor 2 family protein [Aquaticitalea sp.]